MTWTYLLGTLAVVLLVGLTVLLAALIRHVGALQLAVEAGGMSSGESFDVDTDGPAVGSQVPESTLDLLYEGGIGPNQGVLVAVFLSTSCVPCTERASEIVSRCQGLDRTIFLVSGGTPEGLERLRNLFATVDSSVLYDPQAREIVNSLDVKSTPFAFRISENKITGKAYLRSADG
ncbi:hypothetical protein LG324_04260 [Phycicoccus jejuensis]|uniref:hypothetical protein n=1 Tax=Phycicoccus jejuensis TaxID=367299 RepID=UPI00384EA9D3